MALPAETPPLLKNGAHRRQPGRREIGSEQRSVAITAHDHQAAVGQTREGRRNPRLPSPLAGLPSSQKNAVLDPRFGAKPRQKLGPDEGQFLTRQLRRHPPRLSIEPEGRRFIVIHQRRPRIRKGRRFIIAGPGQNHPDISANTEDHPNILRHRRSARQWIEVPKRRYPAQPGTPATPGRQFITPSTTRQPRLRHDESAAFAWWGRKKIPQHQRLHPTKAGDSSSPQTAESPVGHDESPAFPHHPALDNPLSTGTMHLPNAPTEDAE